MNVNAAFVGQMLGGIVGIYLLSSLLEWAAFKRIMDDPVKGKVASVIAAWVVSLFATVFGDSFNFVQNMLAYLFGALIVGVIKHRRGVKIRNEMEEVEGY